MSLPPSQERTAGSGLLTRAPFIARGNMRWMRMLQERAGGDAG